jgi:predicted methyltransferase
VESSLLSKEGNLARPKTLSQKTTSNVKLTVGVLRPALVLLAVFLIVGIGGVAYQGIRTLQQLTAVEADRDQWQRPAEVIRPLNLKDGSVVVDLGSGAGYFALRLSDAVGERGRVIAVDLRSLSLWFLRIRALLQRKGNIRIIVGEPDNPHLSAAAVDSVLIANTYHELTNPQSILRYTIRALRPGGRLVIVDRSAANAESTGGQEEHHHASPGAVEEDLRKQGFNILSRDDTFIHAGNELWWLLVASKP